MDTSQSKHLLMPPNLLEVLEGKLFKVKILCLNSFYGIQAGVKSMKTVSLKFGSRKIGCFYFDGGLKHFVYKYEVID